MNKKNNRSQSELSLLLLVAGGVIVTSIALIMLFNIQTGIKNQYGEAKEEKQSVMDLGYRLVGEQGKFRAIMEMPSSAQTRENFSPKGSAVGGTMPYSYKWTTKNDCIISEPNSETTTINCSTKGKKIIELSVTDSAKTTATTTKSINITPILTSIELSANKNSIKETETTQLTTKAHYNEGPPEDITSKTTYSTNPTDKITIDSSGKATAVAIGSTEITADYSAKKSTPVQITVQQLSAPTISSFNAKGGDAQAMLIWTADNAADLISSYNIYYSQIQTDATNCTAENKLSCTIITINSGATKTQTINGLANKTIYYFKLIAFNKNNSQSSAPLTASATPNVNIAPEAGAITLTPSSGEIIGNNPARINFTAQVKDSDADTITYWWNFGDETTNSTPTTMQSTANFTDTPTITHDYLSPSTPTFTITFFVKDDSHSTPTTKISTITITKSIIPEDIVLFYNFENQTGTTINDKSSNANNGTLIGATGKIESTNEPLNSNYLDFGTTNTANYIQVMESASKKLTNLQTYTISAWIFPTSSNQQAILNKGNIILGTTPTQVFFPNTTTTKTANIVYQKWNHIAISNNNGTTAYYVNGTNKGTANNTASTGTKPLFIALSNAYTYMFSGKMDEIKIYNTAKNQAEIEEEFYKFGIKELMLYKNSNPQEQIQTSNGVEIYAGQSIPITVKVNTIADTIKEITETDKANWSATGGISIDTIGNTTKNNASATISLIAPNTIGNGTITATYRGKSISINVRVKDTKILYFNFETDTGCTETDKSNSGNNGTLTNYTGCPNPITNPRTGIGIGKALVLNGTTNYITTDKLTLSSFPSDEGTVSIWAKPMVFDYRAVFGFQSLPYSYSHIVGFMPNNILRAYVFSKENEATLFMNASTTLTTKWYHLVLTWKKNNNTIFYVNGTQKDQKTFTISQPNQPFVLGQASDAYTGLNQYFQGELDEVKVYEIELTPAQIKENFITNYIRNPLYIDAPEQIAVGETTTLKLFATTLNSNMEDIAANATWTSSDASIASIEANTGIITGKKEGTVTITATIGKFSPQTITITVKPNLSITFENPDPNDTTKCTELDSSGSGNNGKILGYGTDCSNARKDEGITKSMKFDGTNDFVEIDNEQKFDFDSQNPFTLIAWIKKGNNADFDGIISKMAYKGWSSGNMGYSFSVASDGKLRAYLGVENNTPLNEIWANGATIVNNNNWHHVAMTYNGSKTASGIKLYVDGKLETMSQSTTTLSASILNNNKLKIGEADRYNQNTDYFNGFIDEAKVYGKELTIQEIQDIYNAEKTKLILPPPTILYYDFDNPLDTGCTETDKGTYNNNGTIANNCSTAREQLTGFTNKVLNTNNGNNYLTSIASPNDLTGNITFSLWIKPISIPPETSTYGTILSNYSQVLLNNGFEIRLLKSGQIQYITGNGTYTAKTPLTSNTTLKTGNWYFATIVYNSTEQKNYLYINGKLDNSNSDSIGIIDTTKCKILIGGGGYNLWSGQSSCTLANPTQYFALYAQLDNIKISKKAPTQAEITEEMGASSLTITPANPTIAFGNTIQLALKQSFNGRGVDRTSEAVWTAIPNIVSVTNGLVTAGSTAGTATITATYTVDGVPKTATTAITITQPAQPALQLLCFSNAYRCELTNNWGAGWLKLMDGSTNISGLSTTTYSCGIANTFYIQKGKGVYGNDPNSIEIRIVRPPQGITNYPTPWNASVAVTAKVVDGRTTTKNVYYECSSALECTDSARSPNC